MELKKSDFWKTKEKIVTNPFFNIEISCKNNFYIFAFIFSKSESTILFVSPLLLRGQPNRIF